jgi:hypothetical protein
MPSSQETDSRVWYQRNPSREKEHLCFKSTGGAYSPTSSFPTERLRSLRNPNQFTRTEYVTAERGSAITESFRDGEPAFSKTNGVLIEQK